MNIFTKIQGGLSREKLLSIMVAIVGLLTAVGVMVPDKWADPETLAGIAAAVWAVMNWLQRDRADKDANL